jgi:hypothetical protein
MAADALLMIRYGVTELISFLRDLTFYFMDSIVKLR